MKTRTNFGLTVKQVFKKMENKSLRFDNSVQRGYVWDKKKQSALIDTLLSIGKWIPLPPIFVVKRSEETEKGKIEYYDCLDGKQRSLTMYRYKTEQFALEGLDEIEMEDGSFLDVNGLKFSELPEELQDRINDYSFTFNSLEGVSDEEIAMLFAKLNNGKPLSAIELTRVHAKSMDTIMELGKHEIFTESMTEKAISSYANEDVIVKTLIVLNERENPCLDTKVVRPYMSETEITDTDKDRIVAILNRIQDAHDRIAIKEDSMSKKIAKRIYTRTHMISMARVTEKSINLRIGIDEFVAWIEQFYCGTKSPTISTEYNENCSSGSGHTPAVKTRLNVLDDNFNTYFKIENTKEIAE